jgi:hypothetical protein
VGESADGDIAIRIEVGVAQQLRLRCVMESDKRSARYSRYTPRGVATQW